MNTSISKDILNRIENIEKYIVEKEAQSVKLGKESPVVEQWPNVGDRVILQEIGGNITVYVIKDDSFSQWIIKNEICFKSTENYNKYYSIIDTINNIVDELGRPSWGEMRDKTIMLYGVALNFNNQGFLNTQSNMVYNNGSFFPLCIKSYIIKLLEEVSEEDLLWAFKKSMKVH